MLTDKEALQEGLNIINGLERIRDNNGTVAQQAEHFNKALIFLVEERARDLAARVKIDADERAIINHMMKRGIGSKNNG